MQAGKTYNTPGLAASGYAQRTAMCWATGGNTIDLTNLSASYITAYNPTGYNNIREYRNNVKFL
jgi:hypothetical protein